MAAAFVALANAAHADPVTTPVPPPSIRIETPLTERQLEWKPEWSRASSLDYVVTGVGLATALVFALLPPQPTHNYGGVLFDDALRGALRLPTYDERHVASDASDVILSLVTTYPIVFDAFALGYGYWRSADAAYQMTVIDAEALAITSGLQGIANFSASREQPYGPDCGTQIPSALSECNGPNRYRSFFSGHASVSFTSAGLTCSHHLHLHLFGGRADTVACVTALVAASAVSVLRVMADVHYATDVLTGALVGAAVGFGVPALHYANHKRSKTTAFRMARRTVHRWIRHRRHVVMKRGILASLALFLMTVRAHAQAVNSDVWDQGRYRPFISSTIDFGFLYLRPRAVVGWGRPHSTWFGAELNPIFSTEAIGAYGGIRATLPFLDVRVGARGFYLLDHGYLPNQQGYTLTDFNVASGNATYVTWETDVRSVFRVGPGDVGIIASLSAVTGVPAGYSVFEDSLHVIIRPPALWRTRLGYTIFIATQIGRFTVTPVVEALGNPSRGAVTVRAGMLATYLINKHLEVRTTFVLSIFSPDSIGLEGGDFTELGLRYRWASGDR